MGRRARLMAGAAPNTARATAESVARDCYGRLLAFLAAGFRDVAAAEDALAEAFAKALEEWPVRGVPDNPQAWLLTVARRKRIDGIRHERIGENVMSQLQVLGDAGHESADRFELPDRRLALLFACAHPAIDESIRAPLMMQTVLGLDATRIGSAFLVSPAAMAKRLGRAKDKIREAGIPFHVPARDELDGRLGSVLEAIYAAFAASWPDPLGIETARKDLSDEAIFLARLLFELLPGEPEVAGLLACMLHAHARRRARRDGAGCYVALADQRIDLWDFAMIREAESLLIQASAFRAPGRYQLEAALQSAHVERRLRGVDNWAAVLQLYDALIEVTGSPIVAINRTLALAEVEGVEAALAALPDPGNAPALTGYQPYWAARADLLARSGAAAQAHQAYEMAIGLETDDAVRLFLRERQSRLGRG